MESSVAHVCSSSLIVSNFKYRYQNHDSYLSPARASQSRPCHGKLRVEANRRMLWKEVKCTKGGSVSLPEKQLEEVEWQFGDEIITEEELMGLGRLGDKCKEVRGIAELLECLESEAIMGEDEGKEPTDYNRRAQIFDKSSRVFQALKENATLPS